MILYSFPNPSEAGVTITEVFLPNPSEAKKRFGGGWIENPPEVFNDFYKKVGDAWL